MDGVGILNIESMHGELQTPSRLEEGHYHNFAPASPPTSFEDQAPICNIISPRFIRRMKDLAAFVHWAPQQDIDPDINGDFIKRINTSPKEAPRITDTQSHAIKHGYEPGDTTILLDQDGSGEKHLLPTDINFSVR